VQEELLRINEVDFDLFNYFKLSPSREEAFKSGTLEMLKPYVRSVEGAFAELSAFLTKVYAGSR